jgi:ABC-type nitrate/sulfonate/bicarbonate transport system permease component
MLAFDAKTAGQMLNPYPIATPPIPPIAITPFAITPFTVVTVPFVYP